MAIGVLLGRKPIKGSCGGMSALGIDKACDICGGDQKKCEDEQNKELDNTPQQATDNAELAYNAAIRPKLD